MPPFQEDTAIAAIEAIAAEQSIIRHRIKEAVARDWRNLSPESIHALEEAMLATWQTIEHLRTWRHEKAAR